MSFVFNMNKSENTLFSEGQILRPHDVVKWISSWESGHILWADFKRSAAHFCRFWDDLMSSPYFACQVCILPILLAPLFLFGHEQDLKTLLLASWSQNISFCVLVGPFVPCSNHATQRDDPRDFPIPTPPCVTRWLLWQNYASEIGTVGLFPQQTELCETQTVFFQSLARASSTVVTFGPFLRLRQLKWKEPFASFAFFRWLSSSLRVSHAPRIPCAGNSSSSPDLVAERFSLSWKKNNLVCQFTVNQSKSRSFTAKNGREKYGWLFSFVSDEIDVSWMIFMYIGRDNIKMVNKWILYFKSVQIETCSAPSKIILLSFRTLPVYTCVRLCSLVSRALHPGERCISHNQRRMTTK